MLPASLSAMIITITIRIPIAGIATYETYDIALTPKSAVTPIIRPQTRIQNIFQPSPSMPSADENKLPMYSPVIAYQKTWVPPRIMSDHLAPITPKVYLDCSTAVKPVLAPMAHIAAT